MAEMTASWVYHGKEVNRRQVENSHKNNFSPSPLMVVLPAHSIYIKEIYLSLWELWVPRAFCSKRQAYLQLGSSFQLQQGSFRRAEIWQPHWFSEFLCLLTSLCPSSASVRCFAQKWSCGPLVRWVSVFTKL